MLALLLTTGVVPLSYAWLVNRHTTLRPALLWGLATWAAWATSVWSGPSMVLAGALGRYLALSLTACTGVAVLGARRPGVGAWNFVVAGLLVVLLLPVAEGLGQVRLLPAHLIFLSVTLAVVLLNYLPTRLGIAAVLLGFGCGVEVARLAGEKLNGFLDEAGLWAIAVSSWIGLVCACWPRTWRTEFDRTWLAFRDRFGLLWGQRAREQFNRAAVNAGWPVVLRWHGLEGDMAGSGPSTVEALATLRAILKRFGPPNTPPEEPGRSG